METLKDLALAEYENWEDEDKVEVQDEFNEIVADGSDFSNYFRDYDLEKQDIPVEWLNTCEIYKKPRLNFDEFITLKYIFENAETVIICKGCSLLISGRAYFTCNECFFDTSNGRSYNLCCDCYRSKNFKDHHHRRFFCIYSAIRLSRINLSRKEKDKERRNQFIDRALTEFGKDCMEFARSIATDPDVWKKRFGTGLSLTEVEKLDEMTLRTSESPGKMWDAKEEEDNSTSMCRPQGNSRRYIDLLGVQPSEKTVLRMSNN